MATKEKSYGFQKAEQQLRRNKCLGNSQGREALIFKQLHNESMKYLQHSWARKEQHMNERSKYSSA
jgi:hypothetical protein